MDNEIGYQYSVYNLPVKSKIGRGTIQGCLGNFSDIDNFKIVVSYPIEYVYKESVDMLPDKSGKNYILYHSISELELDKEKRIKKKTEDEEEE